jgi:hypothetical protein
MESPEHQRRNIAPQERKDDMAADRDSLANGLVTIGEGAVHTTSCDS